MKEVDLAWAAGFFDGEGCVHLTRRQRKKSKNIEYELRLSIAQAVKLPLEKWEILFGGQITIINPKNEINKFFIWQVSSLDTLKILKLLEPYLILKKEQANVALEFEKLYIGKGNRNKLTEENINKRQALYLRLKELKHKGKVKNDKRSI